MLSSLIDYFIPDDFPDPSGVEVRRARIGVAITFFAVFWALVAAALGLLSQSYISVAVLVLGAAIVSSAPFVLRATGNLALTGHFIIAPIYGVLLFTIYRGGGLHSAPVLWLVLMPLLASLFQKNRTALIWLGIVIVTFAIVTSATIMGYPFPPIRSQKLTDIQYGISLVGLGATTFTILHLKNSVQTWLSEVLRQKESETSAVLETAPDAILTVDATGQILSANQATARIFEREDAEIVGHNIRDLIAELDPKSLDSAVASRVLGESLEYQATRQASEDFPVEVAFGKHDSRIVLVLRDITERKEANDALMLARDEAIEASRAKSTFLANMSHELRTPLNAVIGYSEMIKEEIEFMRDDKIDNVEAVTEFLPDLARIRTAGTHLLALINDILDLSKIEAGKMNIHLEVFEISALIEDIHSTIAPLANKSNNTIAVEIDDNLGFMNSDVTKVRQILFNLLSNACKFTTGGRIDIRVMPDKAYEQLIFEIQDTGMGMSKEQLSEIFEAFTQADSSTTREFGGTGLGLTITSHFCALLGGDIEVESSLDKGSLFRVRLSTNMASQEDVDPSEISAATNALPSASAPTSRAASDGDTVLVVDDDPTMRDLLRRILEREGFTVATAASGSEGLLLAQQLRPDIITLDVMMPAMDGWSLLSRLKEIEELKDIPVIMVTMVADSERGYALGADHYMVKPLNRHKLVGILSQYRSASNKFQNILVVEDDEPTRSMVQRTLDDNGWQVREAENGQLALDSLDEFEPDLVVLDLMMPQMDGFEFLHRFRKIDAHRTTPVIVVTAKELSDEEKTRLRKDADKILAKGARTGGISAREELLAQVRRYAREANPKRLRTTTPPGQT